MSEAKKLTCKYRLEQWAAIIQDRISSGKQVEQWCKENNLSRDSYYYWLRKVKLAAVQKNTITETPLLPKVVPLVPTLPAPENKSPGTAIIIRVNGITLEIQDNASDAIIERTLKILQRIC